MRVHTAVLLFALGLLALTAVTGIVPVAYASSTVGNATKCSSLAICIYTISNSAGTGSASTDGGISGYVGQNFTFNGGSLIFKLPGETLTSTDYGVYSGTAINTKVFNTYGIVYHVTGTFMAADYNTGKIVKGSTNGYVGIKSVARGGIIFNLINGTIKFSPTTLLATVLQVNCTPTSLYQGQYTTCTATVTDLVSSANVPTGHVVFTSSLGFNPTKCTLSGGTCSLKIYPIAGTWPVYAAYSGDATHYKSSTRGPELYVGCNPDQC